ncbi:MAG: PKD domain-containing protein, partial [Promethearchaeota archaeon]
FVGDDGTPSPTFQWDFGDGSANSTDRDPVHQYLSAGNYTVTLTVTDGDGDSDSWSVVDCIEVVWLKPWVDFGVNATDIIAGQWVQFIFMGDEGSPPATFQWDFGDGSPFSFERDPIHQYNDVGTFSVTLTILDADGDVDVWAAANCIRVSASSPVANFTANATSINVGEHVQFIFTGEKGPEPATFLWYFGDGTNSTEENPVHQYLSPGNYVVTLTVTDANGKSSTEVKTDFIIVEKTETPAERRISGASPLFVIGCFIVVTILAVVVCNRRIKVDRHWSL